MKSRYFFIGKELYKLIQVLPKLWLMLSIIPFFSLIRCLILSQILSNHPWSNNTKYLIPSWILINPFISLNLIRSGFVLVGFLHEMSKIKIFLYVSFVFCLIKYHQNKYLYLLLYHWNNNTYDFEPYSSRKVGKPGRRPGSNFQRTKFSFEELVKISALCHVWLTCYGYFVKYDWLGFFPVERWVYLCVHAKV